MVSYCLHITDIDPMKYNLYFERFLNPERVSMPDIDMDFGDTRRGEVVDYVRRSTGMTTWPRSSPSAPWPPGPPSGTWAG